jgi:hypothetical protein
LTCGCGFAWCVTPFVEQCEQPGRFPWTTADDRACDPADTRNCLTLASTSDSGQTWGITPLTRKGFDGVFSQRVTF